MTPTEANALIDIVRKTVDFPGLEHMRDAAMQALREGHLYTVSIGEANEEAKPKSKGKG
jgi:hypothetical protein